MSKWIQLIIGVLAAGATQYGILLGAAVAAGTPVNWLIIGAGVIGTMGTTAAGLLKQLPQREWTPEERAAKLGEPK